MLPTCVNSQKRARRRGQVSTIEDSNQAKNWPLQRAGLAPSRRVRLMLSNLFPSLPKRWWGKWCPRKKKNSGVKRKLVSVLYYITSPLHVVMRCLSLASFVPKVMVTVALDSLTSRIPVHGSHLPATSSHCIHPPFIHGSKHLLTSLFNKLICGSFVKRSRTPTR